MLPNRHVKCFQIDILNLVIQVERSVVLLHDDRLTKAFRFLFLLALSVGSEQLVSSRYLGSMQVTTARKPGKSLEGLLRKIILMESV